MRIFLDDVEMKDVIRFRAVGGRSTVEKFVRDADGKLVEDPQHPGELLVEFVHGSRLVVRSNKD